PPDPRLFPYTTLFRSRQITNVPLLCRRWRCHAIFPFRHRGRPRAGMLAARAGDALGERFPDRVGKCIGKLGVGPDFGTVAPLFEDRKSTRLNSSHVKI